MVIPWAELTQLEMSFVNKRKQNVHKLRLYCCWTRFLQTSGVDLLRALGMEASVIRECFNIVFVLNFLFSIFMVQQSVSL